eukprot:c17365_g1_i1 orf=23-187(-)
MACFLYFDSLASVRWLGVGYILYQIVGISSGDFCTECFIFSHHAFLLTGLYLFL